MRGIRFIRIKWDFELTKYFDGAKATRDVAEPKDDEQNDKEIPGARD